MAEAVRAAGTPRALHALPSTEHTPQFPGISGMPASVPHLDCILHLPSACSLEVGSPPSLEEQGHAFISLLTPCTGLRAAQTRLPPSRFSSAAALHRAWAGRGSSCHACCPKKEALPPPTLKAEKHCRQVDAGSVSPSSSVHGRTSTFLLPPLTETLCSLHIATLRHFALHATHFFTAFFFACLPFCTFCLFASSLIWVGHLFLLPSPETE